MGKIKISFGIICYNEQELIAQQLHNLYPHAHEIIIVEGRTTEFGDKFPKTRDRTLEIIKSFPDDDKKIRLISKDKWASKNNMVNEYYKIATGNYVWHVDSDEFYTDECIKNTIDYIESTNIANYIHDEYYYYRYYNVVISRNGNKFWNKAARIHKKDPKYTLTHRPQLLANAPHTRVIPKDVGIRHHYSIMNLDRVKTKAQFYGYEMHSKYFATYSRPIHELDKQSICVRPDNDGKENSVPTVLLQNELEIPTGIDKIFSYYEDDNYPWTVRKRKRIVLVVDNPFYDVEVVSSDQNHSGDIIIGCGPLSSEIGKNTIVITPDFDDLGKHGYNQ